MMAGKRTTKAPESIVMSAVGKRIIAAFELDARDIADKMGIPAKTLWRYLSGYTIPPLWFLCKVEDMTGYSVGWLLRGKDEKSMPLSAEVLSIALKIEAITAEHPNSIAEISQLLDLFFTTKQKYALPRPIVRLKAAQPNRKEI